MNKTKKLANMGILTAMSVIFVALVHFPIFPAVSFLEYDPADIPILICGFAFGPWSGLAVTLVAAVIQGVTVSAQSGIYGIIMHLLSTGVYVTVSSLLYAPWAFSRVALRSRSTITRWAISSGFLVTTVAMVLTSPP